MKEGGRRIRERSAVNTDLQQKKRRRVKDERWLEASRQISMLGDNPIGGENKGGGGNGNPEGWAWTVMTDSFGLGGGLNVQDGMC